MSDEFCDGASWFSRLNQLIAGPFPLRAGPPGRFTRSSPFVADPDSGFRGASPPRPAINRAADLANRPALVQPRD